MFLSLLFPDKADCCRATCESPALAEDYLTAAKTWHKLAQLTEAVPFNQKYSGLLRALETSTSLGSQGGDCAQYSW